MVAIALFNDKRQYIIFIINNISGHFKVLRKNLKSQHESIKSNTTAFKNLTKEVQNLTGLLQEMGDNIQKISFKLTMDTVDISGIYMVE